MDERRGGRGGRGRCAFSNARACKRRGSWKWREGRPKGLGFRSGLEVEWREGRPAVKGRRLPAAGRCDCCGFLCLRVPPMCTLHFIFRIPLDLNPGLSLPLFAPSHSQAVGTLTGALLRLPRRLPGSGGAQRRLRARGCAQGAVGFGEGAHASSTQDCVRVRSAAQLQGRTHLTRRARLVLCLSRQLWRRDTAGTVENGMLYVLQP